MNKKFIVRDELPEGRAGSVKKVDWAEARQAMIDNAGKWVLIAENLASSTALQLRSGRNRLFRAPELERFEFKALKPEDKAVRDTYDKLRSDVWGRYTKPSSH